VGVQFNDEPAHPRPRHTRRHLPSHRQRPDHRSDRQDWNSASQSRHSRPRWDHSTTRPGPGDTRWETPRRPTHAKPSAL